MINIKKTELNTSNSYNTRKYLHSKYYMPFITTSYVHIQVFLKLPTTFILILSKMNELHGPNHTLSNFHIDQHFDMKKYPLHQVTSGG